MEHQQKQAGITVFYSYTSADKEWRDQLAIHLSQLRRDGLIEEWSDQQILPGSNRTQAIDQAIRSAHMILLLISADFLASDTCYQVEMQHALERHKQGEACVIPIIVRFCDWQSSPFAHLQYLPRNGQPITTWNHPDEAFIDVVAGIRQIIEDLVLLPARYPLPVLPSVWTVPYRRNPFFIGREHVLTYLHEKLTSHKSVIITQPQAISGLGGIGKTQTAIEYAYRYQGDYSLVLWIRADTPETLTSDFMSIAQLLKLAERNVHDQHVIVNAVKHWLEASADWLLILDNADDPTLIQGFLPIAGKGHTLLTTRARPMGKLAQRVELDKMEMEDGVLFLLRRADIIAPNASLEAASSRDRAQAYELVTLLDGLPLALDQAGAYIEETGTDLSRYLELYKTQREKLLRRRSKFPTDHPDPVASTWSLSFQKIEKLNPAAVDLLRFCAFLQPDAIPEEIIMKGEADLGPLLESIAHDPLQLDEAIGELLRFSLVRRHYDSKTLTIHRLVQTVLKDEMDTHAQRYWAERTVRVINQGFSDVSVQSSSVCQLYFPHVLVCTALIDQWNFTFPEATNLLHQAGTYAYRCSQFQEAEMLLQRAVTIREQVLGSGHLDTVESQRGLAWLYLSPGRYEQARLLIEHAIEVYEQTLGPEHPTLAGSLSILAATYRQQEDYERAESLLKRALAISEQAYGPNNSYIANFLADLAQIYTHRKQYKQAEPLIKRTLELLDSEQKTNESGARVATDFEANVLERLAWCYVCQNRYEQAEQLYQRTLVIMEQVQELSPITAQSLQSLAGIYMSQGKYEQAEQLYQRSLKIWEQIIGPEHYWAEDSRYGLVQSYIKQSKYEQALTEYTQLITRNPNNALAYLRRGYVYLHLKQGKYAHADFAKYAFFRPKEVNAAWMAVYSNLGQQKPGTEIAERLEVIAGLDPQSDEAYVCRGIALGLRGQRQEGLTELEQALHLDPHNEDAWFWKGMMCAYLGHSTVALESIEQALQVGLPPLLLTPLFWLEQENLQFYQEYAEPSLKRYGLL